MITGEAARADTGRRVRPTPLTWFLGVLIVILAVYTQLAMGMEWRTEAGRIGPGFFPRVIGLLGILLCGVAAARSLRVTAPAATTPARDRHPRVLAGAVAAMVLLQLLLVPLGAVVASTLFMLGCSWLLDRGWTLRTLVLSLVVPLALYLLLEVWLGAGLPQGILPLP